MQTWPQFKQQLIAGHHRGLVVISGEQTWCLAQLTQWADDNSQTTLWLGEDSALNATCVSASQSKQWLGQECSQLVINGFSGIDLNAIGAITGTLKAGGLCYLLCPELACWPQLNDPQSQRYTVYPQELTTSSNRLISHWINTIKSSDNIVLIEQDGKVIIPTLPASQAATYKHDVYKTEQQCQAVEKIKKVALGHRRRPLVLTADRGRGKSSALGIALGQLLQGNKQNVIISAPQAACVISAFDRAAEQLTVINRTNTQIQAQQGTLTFVPPDELIRHKHTTDILLIDEAAAIPAPMLEAILKQYSRIVFTSTIHGYEGTGRGFEIRFKHTLNKLTPDWQAFSMSQPIRWAPNDPLEQFVNQALMLDAQAGKITNQAISTAQAVYNWWDRDLLLSDTQALSQVIGLLTLAHYKTTPNDFRHLLDGSNIGLYTQTVDNVIIGVALVAMEGELCDEICQQIWQGKRRPNGHLIPQTLSFHGGFTQAPKYSYARVIRIATHPQIHSQGFGGCLLTKLTQYINEEIGVDFIGSSFGATTQLLKFWQQHQFTLVRLGITKETTSNEYSAVILKPLRTQARVFMQRMQGKFDSEFVAQLIEFYPLLSANLVIQLLQQRPSNQIPPLDTLQRDELKGYLEYQKDYEFCSHTLFQTVLIAIANRREKGLSEQQISLIVDKVIRKQSWSIVCEKLGFSGKKSAAVALRQTFKHLHQGS
jgi:tRNA(Met) cytidine acetyltransferase